GPGAHAVAGRERAVLPVPAPRVADRGLGQQAVAGHRVPRRARTPGRRTGAALAAAGTGPDAGLLGRVRARPRDGRVLAVGCLPAARPAALPARRRRLGRRAAFPLGSPLSGIASQAGGFEKLTAHGLIDTTEMYLRTIFELEEEGVT